MGKELEVVILHTAHVDKTKRTYRTVSAFLHVYQNSEIQQVIGMNFGKVIVQCIIVEKDNCFFVNALYQIIKFEVSV